MVLVFLSKAFFYHSDSRCPITLFLNRDFIRFKFLQKPTCAPVHSGGGTFGVDSGLFTPRYSNRNHTQVNVVVDSRKRHPDEGSATSVFPTNIKRNPQGPAIFSADTIKKSVLIAIYNADFPENFRLRTTNNKSIKKVVYYLPLIITIKVII